MMMRNFSAESFAPYDRLLDVQEEEIGGPPAKEVIVMKSYGEFYKNIEGGAQSNFLRRVNSPYFVGDNSN